MAMQEAPWEPKADKSQTRESVVKYRMQPALWDGNEKEIENLQKHAEFHRIPFARNKKHQDNFVMGALKNFGSGWGAGFSANLIRDDDEPDDFVQSVSRQLGNLAGFLGYIPGARFIKPLRAIAKFTRNKSIPMRFANSATKGMSKLYPSLKRDAPSIAKIFQKENKLGDALSGAFHLGVASGVSDWRGIVDEGMPRALESIGMGGLWGGGFRALGNTKMFGKRLTVAQTDRATGLPIPSKLEPGQIVDYGIRAAISSITAGKMAEMEGAPTEQQIYEYAMGAAFSFNDTPLQTRIARNAIHDTIRKNYGYEENFGKVPDAEVHPEYDTWTPEMQKFVKKDFDAWFGQDAEVKAATLMLQRQAMKNEGLTQEDIEKTMDRMVKKNIESAEFNPDGELIEPLLKAEIKKVKDIIKDNPNNEDYQDLDMHINDLENLPGRISGGNGYVDQYITPRTKETSSVQRLVQSLKISKKWDSLHSVVQGVSRPKDGAVEEMMDYIKKEYKVENVDQKEVDWWRNWAEQTRKKRLVLQTYYKDGEVAFIDKGVSPSGQKKELAFEPPGIQQVFDNLQSLHGEDGPQNFYTISDFFVRKGKEYGFGSIDRNRLQSDLNKESDGTGPPAKSDNVIRQIKSKMATDLDKAGYYYVGGRGDKSTMYFVKKNPMVKSKNRTKDIEMIEKAYEEAGFSKADFRQHLLKMGIKYKVKFASIDNYYKDSLINNVYYDIHNNFGSQVTKEQFPKMLVKMFKSDGFIKDAKAYNKRAQIWFNSGQTTNSKVANEYLKKFYRKFRSDYDLPKDWKPLEFVGKKKDKIKISIWNDELMSKDAGTKQDRDNMKRGESFDGGIPALPEFIYALNKANGLTNEGKVNKSFITSPDAKNGALLGKYMFFEASPKLQKAMREKGIHALAPKSGIKQMGYRRFAKIKLNDFKPLTPESKKKLRVDFEAQVRKLIGVKGLFRNAENERKRPLPLERIGDIYLLPEARKKGVGTEFANLVEDYKRALGLREIEIMAVGGRKGTEQFDNVEFWKKQGYKVLGKSTEVTVGKGVLNPEIRGKKVAMVRMQKKLDVETERYIQGPSYEIPLKDIRTVLSEVTSARDMVSAKLAKQMWSTITHFGNTKTDPAKIKSMADELIRGSVEGDEALNKAWDSHIKSPNNVSEQEILKNIDDVSLDRLMNAVTDTNNESFSSKVYDKVLKRNLETTREGAKEAEVIKDEYYKSIAEVSEFDSILDRVGELYPEGNNGFYLHKIAKNYRQNAVKNYIVDRISRPKLKNGMKSRMRPWDHGMWDDLSALNVKQDEFYLDEGARKKKIYDPYFARGYEELGKIWDEYNKPENGIYKNNPEIVKDILEAVAMRVPMDSMSGAHVLKFKGFTKAKGQGVLLHGRVMDALGGADLDGDKAFIFFGGKSGMWKDWKEIYKAQKDEFIDKDNNEIPAKDEYSKSKFVDKNVEIAKYNGNPISKYDPNLRAIMSDASSDGRDTLGTAVTSRQALASAYDTIKLSKGTTFGPVRYIKGKYLPTLLQDGSYYFPVKTEKGKVVYVKQTPKRSLNNFKQLSRAAINLGADPMDEMGIVSGDVMKQVLNESAFTYEFANYKTVGKKNKQRYVFSKAHDLMKNNDALKQMLANLSKGGLHQNYSNANNALYGRNFQTGKKYSLGEIQSGTNDISWVPEEGKRNLLNFIADEYKQIPYEDNLFKRLNVEELNNLYDYNKRELSDRPDLLKLFNRTSMGTRQGPMMREIIANKLYLLKNRDMLSKNANKEKFWDLFTRKWHPQFDALNAGRKQNVMGTIPSHLYGDLIVNRKNASYKTKMQYLEHKLNQAEDFLVNDLSDMSSLKHILSVRDKHSITDRDFKRVNALVNSVKNDSFWVKKNQKDLRQEIQNVIEETGDAKTGEGFLKLIEGAKKGGDSGKAQQEVDRQILIDKKSLKSTKLNELYDSMLLGTFQQTNKRLLNYLDNMKGYKTPPELRFIEVLRKAGQNTALLRLGFQSPNVKDASIKAHLNEYNKLYKAIVQPTAKEVEEAYTAAKGDESDNPTRYLNDLGEPVRNKIIEASNLSESELYYSEMIEPFAGQKKAPIKDKELLRLSYKIKNHLNHYHNLDTRDFNGLFRSMFQKNINMANKSDLQDFERFFQDMRDGSTWTRFISWVSGKKDKRPEIERRYWNRFPEANQREWLKYPGMVKWKEDVTPYKDRFNNSIMGRSIRPTTVIGDIQNFAWKGAEFALSTTEEETKLLQDELSPYTQTNTDGSDLHKIAVSIRERNMVHHIKEIMGDDPLLMNKQRAYLDNYNEVQPLYNKLKKKIYAIPAKDGVKNLTGEEVINKINDIYTRKNKDIGQIINGDTEWYDNFTKVAYNKNGEITWRGLDKLYSKYLSYSKEKFRLGQNFEIKKFGVNGMQEINKLVALKFSLPVSKRSYKLLKEYSGKLGLGKKVTELWDAEAYYPHVSFDRKNIDILLSKSLDAIFKNTKSTKREKQEEAKKLIYQSKTMTGDWAPKSISEENFDAMQDVYTRAAGDVRRKGEKNILPLSFKQSYSQYQRESHLPGWSREAEAYEANIKNLVDSFYKESMLTLSRAHIQEFYRKFRKQSNDKDLSNRWSNFLKLFTQSSMGYPIDIPESVQNDPKMKISYTPYKSFADSNVRKRIDSIRNKLGITSKALKKYGVSKEDAQDLNQYSQSKLQFWSGLEAKWQMASLLAHPKSAITNLFGGQVHTGISAGVENLKNARDIDYLKTNINPKWRSMRDVEQWVESLGIVEEFLLHEAGMNKELRGRRMENFVKDFSSKLKGKDDLKDTEYKALIKKHKITDSMWNKASWFMRRPERTLRRDAFIAHYIQAKKNFGGAIKDYDHPFLIEMGRRGVKATQFLYSAPFRPMWTNSALGRVMSRFQLWSWNSVRFRKDLLAETRLRGFTPGTPAFNRAKRLVTADAMMYGLSGMFMYSLFDNALPAPWNWFQDTAAAMFGTDEERERAFFGHPAGPLSIVKPPLLRFDQPIYEGLMNGNWDKMTDYYLYTLLPFGRIIKDVVGPGGAMENPFYAVEKFTGVPYIQGGKFLQEAKKGDKDAKGIFSDLY